MLNSVILDVAIGLIFMFCLISLAAATIREIVEGVLKTRAIMLERGIRELVGDPTERTKILDGASGARAKASAVKCAVAESVTKALYEHPQISGLFAGAYPEILQKPFRAWLPADRIGFRSTLPSYIPSRNFSVALLDYVARGPIDAPVGAGPFDTAPMDMAMIRGGLTRLSNVRVRRGLLSALDGVGDDLERAREAVAAWYDSGMDRVSGWYRRETQGILLLVGLLLAVGMNVDAVAVGQRLLVDAPWRDALVKDAQVLSGDDTSAGTDAQSAPPKKPPSLTGVAPLSGPTPPASASATPKPPKTVSGVDALEVALKDHGFMIGTPLRARPEPSGTPSRHPVRGWFLALLGALPGYLVVALAATLGAPFWFDLLNKLIVVRSTVKPHEKSREEGAKDGPTDKNRPELVVEKSGADGDARALTNPSAAPSAAAVIYDDDDDVAALDPALRPREGNEVVDV